MLKKVIITFLCAMQCCVAWSASLQFSPTNILFDGQSTIQTLRLTNLDNTDVVLQLDVSHWRQDGNGKDVHEPTKAVLVTPPLIRLEGGASQVVRIALLEPTVQTQEKTYRLLVREVIQNLPSIPKKQQLNIAIQSLLPIFVAPQVKKEPLYSSSTKQITDRKINVFIKNDGLQHFLITKFIIQSESKKVIEEQNAFVYLLAGSSKTISLKTAKKIPHNATITFQLNS